MYRVFCSYSAKQPIYSSNNTQLTSRSHINFTKMPFTFKIQLMTSPPHSLPLSSQINRQINTFQHCVPHTWRKYLFSNLPQIPGSKIFHNLSAFSCTKQQDFLQLPEFPSNPQYQEGASQFPKFFHPWTVPSRNCCSTSQLKTPRTTSTAHTTF